MHNRVGPERFITVKQCRTWGALAPNGLRNVQPLDVGHLARLVVYEAMQPGTNLQQFLRVTVLFGNSGEITISEMNDLARELFASERSEGYLTQLRNDHCIGYSSTEEEQIRALLSASEVSQISVAIALGYIPPSPRRY